LNSMCFKKKKYIWWEGKPCPLLKCYKGFKTSIASVFRVKQFYEGLEQQPNFKTQYFQNCWYWSSALLQNHTSQHFRLFDSNYNKEFKGQCEWHWYRPVSLYIYWEHTYVQSHSNNMQQINTAYMCYVCGVE
jgi:hypothetical protein